MTRPGIVKRAVVAALSDGKDVLMQVKDQFHPYGGCGLWSLFGGAQDPDELPENTLHRELQEELRWAIPLVGAKITALPTVVGDGWIWVPYAIVVDTLPSAGVCTEGIAARISIQMLDAMLLKEGTPVQKGPRKDEAYNIFFPGIWRVCTHARPHLVR
jgi:8-oxo-dGTP pyrophosphatase MutT (NUDIX family)